MSEEREELDDYVEATGPPFIGASADYEAALNAGAKERNVTLKEGIDIMLGKDPNDGSAEPKTFEAAVVNALEKIEITFGQMFEALEKHDRRIERLEPAPPLKLEDYREFIERSRPEPGEVRKWERPKEMSPLDPATSKAFDELFDNLKLDKGKPEDFWARADGALYEGAEGLRAFAKRYPNICG